MSNRRSSPPRAFEAVDPSAFLPPPGDDPTLALDRPRAAPPESPNEDEPEDHPGGATFQADPESTPERPAAVLPQTQEPPLEHDDGTRPEPPPEGPHVPALDSDAPPPPSPDLAPPGIGFVPPPDSDAPVAKGPASTFPPGRHVPAPDSDSPYVPQSTQPEQPAAVPAPAESSSPSAGAAPRMDHPVAKVGDRVFIRMGGPASPIRVGFVSEVQRASTIVVHVLVPSPRAPVQVLIGVQPHTLRDRLPYANLWAPSAKDWR